jgi:uncharacterized protein
MVNKLEMMLKKYIILLGLFCCGWQALVQDYPAKPDALVTDYTQTLSDTDRQQLENKLDAFNDNTSTQIAVVIMKTTGGADIEEYGTGLAKYWGIGQQGKNNGALILVALDDRKVTIRTGLGTARIISNETASEIITDDILPRFKVKDYYGGLDAATSHIMQLMRTAYTNDAQGQPQQQKQQEGDNGVGIFIIIVIVVVVLIIIFRRRGGGGGGQIISSRDGASPFWWFLGGSLLGGALGSNWGNDWGNNNGGGYDNGGGGDYGGDSGGGDSGGFGGGDFGGDGSSGSW